MKAKRMPVRVPVSEAEGMRRKMQVELVRIQRESGLTTIFVTHDQEEALTLSDKVAILDRGRIAQIGAPTEVYERSANRFVTEFLGDTNVLQGTVEPGGIVLAHGQRIASTIAPPPVGELVTLAVRPEEIEIRDASDGGGDDAQGAQNQSSAVITGSIHSGTPITYEAVAAHGLRLKIFA